MSLPVAILAGGYATRLMPLTRFTPKSLIDVAGEPFIFHQLRLLARGGITKVVLLLGHMGADIAEAVGTGSRFGLAVDFSYDGPQPCGTAGAILRAMSRLGPEFGVLYGDSYLTCDYAAIIRQFGKDPRPAMMTVYRNDGRWGDSNVLFEQDTVRLYDKLSPLPGMHYIDYGFGLFRPTAFAGMAVGVPADLATVYHRLSRANQLAGFEVPDRFHEIGSIAGLEDLRRALLSSQEA